MPNPQMNLGVGQAVDKTDARDQILRPHALTFELFQLKNPIDDPNN